MEKKSLSKIPSPSDHNIGKMYISEGFDARKIASRLKISQVYVEEIIKKNQLDVARENYVRESIEVIQKEQVSNATKLLNMENLLKDLRIKQLEATVEQFMQYYEKHGHLNKLHPETGEMLLDTNDMPVQLNIPSVVREITQLKESVSLSEGMRQLLNKLDRIVNGPKSSRRAQAVNEIDVSEYSELFEPRDKSED